MAPYFLHWHAGHDLAQSEVLLCMKKGQSLALSDQKALHGPEHEVSTSSLKKGVATMHPVHLLVNTKAIGGKGGGERERGGGKGGVEKPKRKRKRRVFILRAERVYVPSSTH